MSFDESWDSESSGKSWDTPLAPGSYQMRLLEVSDDTRGDTTRTTLKLEVIDEGDNLGRWVWHDWPHRADLAWLAAMPWKAFGIPGGPTGHTDSDKFRQVSNALMSKVGGVVMVTTKLRSYTHNGEDRVAVQVCKMSPANVHPAAPAGPAPSYDYAAPAPASARMVTNYQDALQQPQGAMAAFDSLGQAPAEAPAGYGD